METCCKGTCCLEQTTFCCPKDELHPDRCCPRWTVCCTDGDRFGCCQPDTLTNSSTVAYAIFVEVARVWALTLDYSEGRILRQVPVRGFNNWGEITRVFIFDADQVLFYYIEANFTAPRPDSGRPVTLYTVDPRTGDTRATVVQGATDFPAGYALDEATGLLVIATTIGDPYGQGPGPDGYRFYSLDPKSAVATLISTAMISDASSPFAYVGYFASYQGGRVFRLGYRDPQAAQDQGLGVTTLAAPNASTTWNSSLPLLPLHDFYLSLTPSGPDRFLSLAPRRQTAALDLVAWGLSAPPVLVGALADAHNVPLFGPLAESVNVRRQVYVAGVVHNGASMRQDFWALAVADLRGNNVTSLLLQPHLLAETNSVAGIGIPNV